MMRNSQKFVNSMMMVAGLAAATILTFPTTAGAESGEMTYQLDTLQQSLRATNARVAQLEKELTRLRNELRNWSTAGKQQQVSYSGNSHKIDRPAPSTQGSSIHHVASGDTLSSISRRYGLGLDRLIASNPGLDPHRIRIGQAIVIPKSGAGAPAKSASAPPAPAATKNTSGEYTVRAGDTLSSIARRHSTNTAQLLALNGLKNPNALQIGQQLTVPGGKSQAASGNRFGSQPKKKSTRAPAPVPAPAPEPQKSSELLTAPDGYGYYEVVKRDTLYSIALSFSTTSRELRSLNKLEGDDELSVGQYLLVPVADDSLYES